ncbi:MAG: hypothetical protein NZM35_08950, partial [Chitinophagales bacterium]|nr:hypothetical protein [Chitinophagales bacterium]
MFRGCPCCQAMQGSRVGLVTGFAAAPAAPVRWFFLNGTGAAASLRSRPSHPSPEQALRQPLFYAERK